MNAKIDTPELLAPWTYHSAEFLQLEIAMLFKRNWLLAGHINDIPAARDYLTFDAFGERALVLRDDKNEIRAFHNICRHRGAKLLGGTRGQCRAALTCPFHGWRYQLDGQLFGVPAADTFAGLDKRQHNLVSLPMSIWMGFIFVYFGDGTPPPTPAVTLKPVEALITPYQLEKMKPVTDCREYVHYDELRPYNWKILHDIDNEGYHVPVGHPGLQQLYGDEYCDGAVDNVSVTTAPFNNAPADLWSVRHYQKMLPRNLSALKHLPEKQQQMWLYIGMFPNLVFALYPEGVEFYMTIPVDVNSTRLIGGGYALPSDQREMRALRYLGARINRVATREDDLFMRRLRQGMQSSAFPAARLSSLEHGVRAFHRDIQRILPLASLSSPPAAGTMANVNVEMLARL